MKTPNNRIKEALNEKGIKQTWLAEQLGKSFAMVNAYVGNHRQLSLDMIAQIADILQVEPIDLIVFVDKKVKN
ncbi:DNA-binding helix-turn-helix protein [Prevotella sp. oral taxon 306 str. F0472]|uniref:helix-turn-helix domain-containing protein n=1 Tax=Prevotella sp. oral taxon 306 TaxID=712461 RepID=UPI00025BBF44|nr:helix-turn-helix transcriptional regulator [Prevotella sp. oral taxon 306]EID32685.1 DNA-binding helix-turn-helix protein [Prevotella sp. oral taxon 306 str. F0472]